MRKLVAIIILNWNAWQDTLECLRSVYAQDYPNYRVLVVDNGSTNDSVAQIRTAFPQVEILETGENLGYAGGNNRGLQWALAQGVDYAWILNDDLTVASDCLTHLIAVAGQMQNVGFFGPAILCREQPQTVLTAGGRLDQWGRSAHAWMGQSVSDLPMDAQVVDYLSGACLLVRGVVMEQVGLLYEPLFAYHEDVEWCARAAKMGWRSCMVPQAHAWHPDTRARDADSVLVTYYTVRNGLWFWKTYYGRKILWRAVSGYLRTLLSWTLRRRWKAKRQQRDALALALWDFLCGRYGPWKGV